MRKIGLPRAVVRAAAFAMLIAVPATLAARQAAAVTDEIQVYTGDIEAPGVFGLTWHNNYTPDGLKTPAFPSGLADNHAYSSVTEFAYGVTPWLEAGLYLPLYAYSENRGWTYNGFKVRALFVQPDNKDKSFYYGVNFEFSWNAPQWEQERHTSEIRPIIGYRFDNGVSFTFNPIVDNSYQGFSRFEFVPATRLDYAIDETWTVAAEEYDDFGQLRRFLPSSQQFHQVWAVADYNGDPISIEAGIGFGLTSATDHLAFKLMFSTDLTGERGLFGR